MRKRAFTLIELLVVIAIIAILAAILFPVFAKARERAMLTTCVNNNKQLGTAFIMYTEDTGGVLPPWADYRNNVTWDAYIMPMVKATGSFTCPSNRSPQVKQAAAKGLTVRSYSFPRNVDRMPMGRMRAPSKTVLLFEKGSQVLGIGADATGEWFGQSVTGATDVRFTETNPDKWTMFHNNGKVFLFADGHAKWYKAILNESDDNPFGYAFGPFPPGISGNYRLGICSDRNDAGTGGPKVEMTYGTNLPR